MKKIIPLWSTLLKFTTAKSSVWVLAMIVFPPLIQALETFKHVLIVDAFVFKLQSYYIALAYISISFWLIRLFSPKVIKDYFSKDKVCENISIQKKRKRKYLIICKIKGILKKSL